MNTLYYGDNLEIMKSHIPDESIDLIYLDPPFQSGRNYNIIFRPESGGVKGGKSLNPGMVRDLKGTRDSQGADFGILITLVEPTKGVIEEAAKSGDFSYSNTSLSTPIAIPRIQIITAAQLFMQPIPVILPQTAFDPFKKPDIKKGGYAQGEIELL